MENVHDEKTALLTQQQNGYDVETASVGKQTSCLSRTINPALMAVGAVMIGLGGYFFNRHPNAILALIILTGAGVFAAGVALEMGRVHSKCRAPRVEQKEDDGARSSRPLLPLQAKDTRRQGDKSSQKKPT